MKYALLLGALLAAGIGCRSQILIARGHTAVSLVDELSEATGKDRVYTFRWLRRPNPHEQTGSPFDGMVIDLHGRLIEILRGKNGDHQLRLQVGRVHDTSVLQMSAKELPALQTVVHEYGFAPYVITDTIGAPQVVVYAPTPTRVWLRRERADSWVIDIQRLRNSGAAGHTGSTR
jgi:hypothetical protein